MFPRERPDGGQTRGPRGTVVSLPGDSRVLQLLGLADAGPGRRMPSTEVGTRPARLIPGDGLWGPSRDTTLAEQ